MAASIAHATVATASRANGCGLWWRRLRSAPIHKGCSLDHLRLQPPVHSGAPAEPRPLLPPPRRRSHVAGGAASPTRRAPPVARGCEERAGEARREERRGVEVTGGGEESSAARAIPGGVATRQGRWWRAGVVVASGRGSRAARYRAARGRAEAVRVGGGVGGVGSGGRWAPETAHPRHPAAQAPRPPVRRRSCCAASARVGRKPRRSGCPASPRPDSGRGPTGRASLH